MVAEVVCLNGLKKQMVRNNNFNHKPTKANRYKIFTIIKGYKGVHSKWKSGRPGKFCRVTSLELRHYYLKMKQKLYFVPLLTNARGPWSDHSCILYISSPWCILLQKEEFICMLTYTFISLCLLSLLLYTF